MKLLYFDSNLTKIFFQGTNDQLAIIGPDNGLTPNSRHAIILTNDGLFHLYIYASIGLGKFKVFSSIFAYDFLLDLEFFKFWNVSMA